MAARLNTISTPLRRLHAAHVRTPLRAARSPSRPTSAAPSRAIASRSRSATTKAGAYQMSSAVVAARAKLDLNPANRGSGREPVRRHAAVQDVRVQRDGRRRRHRIIHLCIAVGHVKCTGAISPSSPICR